MEKSKKTNHIAIRLPSEIHKYIEDKAASSKLTKSALIIRLLRQTMSATPEITKTLKGVVFSTVDEQDF